MKISMSQIALAALCFFFSINSFAKGQWYEGKMDHEGIQRTFFTYVPEGAKQNYDVILSLHGCTQGAVEYTEIAKLDKLADEKGLVIVAPEQHSSENTYQCWNWFEPRHQKRNAGEADFMMAAIKKARNELALEKTNNYVVGFSSGGAFASILASCYPDQIKGAAIHSGLQYKAATDMSGAFVAMSIGSSKSPSLSAEEAIQCSQTKRPVPVVVFHGTSDYTVKAKNGEQATSQFLIMHDLVDDGEQNESINLKTTGPQNLAVKGGRQYVQEDFMVDGKLAAREVIVQGMSHAWSGGNQGRFSDPKGPDAAALAWDFFQQIQ